jgi:hypothetical protein
LLQVAAALKLEAVALEDLEPQLLAYQEQHQ